MTASAFVRNGRSAISPLTASKLAMPVRSRWPALIESCRSGEYVAAGLLRLSSVRPG
jgi:hypothetical protein